jgi:hypothetical protein
MYNDEFSQYLVESTSNYFDRYGKMYGEGFDEYDELDEELDELIDTLLDEGYSVEECVEAFAEMDEYEIADLFTEAIDLHELNPYAAPGSKEAKKYARATTRSKRGAERAAKIAAVKTRVKGKVQSAIGKIRNAVDTKAREYAANRKLISSKSGKTKLSSPAIQGKQRTSAGRREVRKAVVKDVGKRALGRVKKAGAAIRSQASAAKKEIGAGVRGAIDVAKQAGKSAKKAGAFYGREIPGTAQSAGRIAKGAVQKRAGAAKQGLKQRIGQGALKVAKRMGVAEEMDIFDAVLNYILEEGYAVSFQEAYEIMTELDDDTIDDILEEVGYEFID